LIVAELDEVSLAKAALDGVWSQLAVYIDRAKRLEADAAKAAPGLTIDPEANAMIRWLFLFESELHDVHAVHRAAETGGGLPLDDLRIATETGEELLRLVRDASRFGRFKNDESRSTGETDSASARSEPPELRLAPIVGREQAEPLGEERQEVLRVLEQRLSTPEPNQYVDLDDLVSRLSREGTN
jgi:hypothetical protein